MLTAWGLGGLGIARLMMENRWGFLGLSGLLLAGSFYLNVVKYRSRRNVIVFGAAAALVLLMQLGTGGS